MSSLLASIICDVKRVPIPTSLRRCLRKKDQRLPLTDEQISTSCLLQFQWSNRKPCDKVSKQTFDWLSSLVEKSQQRPSFAQLNGSGSSVNRPKRQTTGSQPRQRKEYRMLTDQERDDYHKAINDLKKDTSVRPNKYDALAEYHKNTLGNVHKGVAFVGWHRYYLVLEYHVGNLTKADWSLFENLCQAELQSKMFETGQDPILTFNTVLTSIADRTIPKTSANPKHPSKPWFDDACDQAIGDRKKSERRFNQQPTTKT
ncbi:Hypothetical predicted protein [Mytilus galloprovincialis]|nr:Hypothetical predicted protein [Mytilus galloprovincialis]